MKTIATVSKSTKRGLSVWNFCTSQDGLYCAIGGLNRECKFFNDLDALQACLRNYIRYGYVDNASKLPAELQLGLALL